MIRRTFLDLTEKELAIHISGKNGKNGFSSSFSSAVEPGYAFSFENRADAAGESVLSIPLSLLNFRILELPFSDMKRIRELLPLEIDGLVLGGAGSVVFDALVLGKTNGRHRILVACLLKETLRTILEKLKSRGFDPSAVTCLELSHILASDPSGAQIANHLVCPPALTEQERKNISLKEMEVPTLNLRRDDFAYTVDTDKTRKSLKMTMALAAMLFIIFFVDTTMTMISIKRENARIREEIRKTYRGLFPNETKVTSELYQLKAHIKELREKEASFVGISPLRTLLDLSHAVRSGISLTEIDQDREIVVFKGECPSLSDVQKFANDLQGTFGDVVVADTKTSTRNRILFTVTAKPRKTS